MRRSLVTFISLVALSGCDVFTPTEYIPEIGYHQGERQVWETGERYRSKDECVRRAIGRYNEINAQSPRRAFSWACRVMKGDAFESRTR